MIQFTTGCTELGPADHFTDVQVKAHDKESLLHDFLDEMLFRFSTGSVPVEYDHVKVDLSAFKMQAEVGFVPYKRAIHGQGSEVKAVTFSNLQVNNEKSPFDIYVIVDI